MNRKIKIILAIAIIGSLGYGGWKVYHNIYFASVKEEITIMAKYIESCGDCPPLWEIDSILNSGEKNYSYLIKKEMRIIYKNKTLENEIGRNANWNCIICIGIQISGKIKNTLSGKYKFFANTYRNNFTNNQECCSEQK